MNNRILFIFCFFLLAGLNNVYSCIPQINWAKSVSFCSGNSIVLNATNANSTYSWSTGATTPTITVTTSGIYYVKVTNICGSASDTIQVYVDHPMTVNLGNDRKMCSSGNPTLSAPYSPSATYLWQDNSTSHQIAVTQSGTYHVRVSNACATTYDTVVIQLDDPLNVNLGPDINNCTATTNIIGFPGGQKGKIIWNTWDTTNTIVVTSPGIYWVKMTNGCGIFRDTVKVTHNQGSLLDIGDTINICTAGSALISSNISGGSYLWSTNATSSSITVFNPGLYWLKYTDNCGSFYDTVYVQNTGPPVTDLGSDTTICYGDVFYLDAGNPGSNYNWSTGGSGRTLKVDTNGTYWVGVDNGCGLTYDTINVNLSFVPIDSIGDTAYYCDNGYVDVNAGRWGPTSYYHWDDGSTSRVHRYSSQGNHWVKVGNHCDTIQVDFYVKKMQMPPFDLGNDTVVCGPITLDTELPDRIHDFLWSTGGTEPYQNIVQTGTYWVKVMNPCGIFTDTIHVMVTHPPALSTKRNVILCQGGTISLVANPNDTVTRYRWSTGAQTNAITVNSPGTYFVQAINLCDTLYDSVTVSEVKPINFDLGPDTILCEPDILYLNATASQADSVRWSTGSANGAIPILTTGTYWIKMYNGCGVFTDTIHVQILKKPKKLFTEKAFCIGGSVSIDATRPHVNSYQWNTGATSPSIVASQQGWYWVDLMSDCGIIRDSVFVRQDAPIQPFSLGNDTIFCTGALWLDPGIIPGATYEWQDGTHARRHHASVSGTYWVTAENTCNSYTDSITILITGPPKLVLGDSVKFCNGSTFTLNAQNPGCTYLWNDGSTGQYLSSDTAGKYWVTITNPCGTLTDTVQLITEFPLLDLELGNDTVICKGDTLMLDADYDNIRVLWNTGHTDRYLTVTETGNYVVEISNSCGVWVDSIYVEVQDVPVFSLGPDSTICNIDGKLFLEGPRGMESYEWSNGSKSLGTTFTQPGIKWLRVSNKCFEYTDSIFLKGEDPIEIELGNDTVLCLGDSLILFSGVVDYPITWSTGATGAFLKVGGAGVYWASARNSCGLFSDTIVVQMDVPPPPGPYDTLVCLGDSAIMDIRNTRTEIVWFDGATDKFRAFAEEGSYPATLTNACGTFYRDFEVRISNCNCPLFVANAFTPNDDGLNDEFKVIHDCDIRTFELVIFNRWGGVVFQSNNPEEWWDGTVEGKPAPIGTYNYRLNYSWMVYNVDHENIKRGLIHIIR